MDEKQWKDPSPWVPMKRAIDQKHVGKLLEELGELVEAASFYVLAGGVKTKLENELADVMCGMILAQEHFGLEFDYRTQDTDLIILLTHAGNAIAALSRCLIQGVDEKEPVTGKPNREWLQEAFSNLTGQIVSVSLKMKLDLERMAERTEFKKRHLRAWHAMLGAEGDVFAKAEEHPEWLATVYGEKDR